MRRLGPISLLLATLAISAAPTGAMGQEDGVTLDPGDPAAKEYALPTEEARRETSKGTGAAIEHGANDSALFGEGVSRDDDATKQAGATNRSGKTGDGADEPDATTPASAATGSGGGGTGGPNEPDEASLSGGPSSGLVLAGGGLLVLAAAGVGGFALRALRSPADV